MFDILNNCYAKYFKNNQNKYEQINNNFEFVDAYLSRYNYIIKSIQPISSDKKVHIEFDIINDDLKYSSVYGFIDLSLDNIYVEVNKVLYDLSFCIFEYLDIKDDKFEGDICDYVLYNTSVIIFENNERYEQLGNTCPTYFDNNGIKDKSGLNIPYSSNNCNQMIEEIKEMHELDKDEITESFNFDDIEIESLIVHLDNVDMDLRDFNKIYHSNHKIKRRGRRK